jgi:hypothetical protein
MVIKEVVSQMEVNLKSVIPQLESKDVFEITKAVFRMAVFLNSKKEEAYRFDLDLSWPEYPLPKKLSGSFWRALARVSGVFPIETLLDEITAEILEISEECLRWIEILKGLEDFKHVSNVFFELRFELYEHLMYHLNEFQEIYRDEFTKH